MFCRGCRYKYYIVINIILLLLLIIHLRWDLIFQYLMCGVTHMHVEKANYVLYMYNIIRTLYNMRTRITRALNGKIFNPYVFNQRKILIKLISLSSSHNFYIFFLSWLNRFAGNKCKLNNNVNNKYRLIFFLRNLPYSINYMYRRT